MRSIPTHSPSNVVALDDLGPGGASHLYGVQPGSGPAEPQRIQFQCGPRNAPSSVPGMMDDDLLAIVEDRLVGFLAGPFASPESAQALEHIRSARESLGHRVAERISRGVLGRAVK